MHAEYVGDLRRPYPAVRAGLQVDLGLGRSVSRDVVLCRVDPQRGRGGIGTTRSPTRIAITWGSSLASESTRTWSGTAATPAAARWASTASVSLSLAAIIRARRSILRPSASTAGGRLPPQRGRHDGRCGSSGTDRVDHERSFAFHGKPATELLLQPALARRGDRCDDSPTVSADPVHHKQPLTRTGHEPVDLRSARNSAQGDEPATLFAAARRAVVPLEVSLKVGSWS